MVGSFSAGPTNGGARNSGIYVNIWSRALRDWNSGQILGHDDVAGEYLGRLVKVAGGVGIPRGEMGEHESPHPAVRRDLGCLPRGQVPIPVGELVTGCSRRSTTSWNTQA